MNKPISRIPIQKNGSKTTLVKITNFQVVQFHDPQQENRPVIIMYALGEDGIIYEFNGAKWSAYPIKEDCKYV